MAKAGSRLKVFEARGVWRGFALGEVVPRAPVAAIPRHPLVRVAACQRLVAGRVGAADGDPSAVEGVVATEGGADGAGEGMELSAIRWAMAAAFSAALRLLRADVKASMAACKGEEGETRCNEVG